MKHFLNFFKQPVRLDHTNFLFLQELFALPMSKVQHTNRATVVSSHSTNNEIVEYDHGFWHPSTGLSFNPDKIAAVYALPPEKKTFKKTIYFHIYLAECQQPIQLELLLRKQNAEQVSQFISKYYNREEGIETLYEFENLLEDVKTPCPCCQQAVKERRSRPVPHPIFSILYYLYEEELPMLMQVKSYNSEMNFEMFPQTINVTETVTVSGTDHQHVLHLDVGYLHALTVKNVTIDGETYSKLSAYDMFGTNMFSFNVYGENHALAWQNTCKSIFVA